MLIIFCSFLLSFLYLIGYQVRTSWFVMFHICSFTLYPHLSHWSLALAPLHFSWSVIPLQDQSPPCHIQSQQLCFSESLQFSCSVKPIFSWSTPTHTWPDLGYWTRLDCHLPFPHLQLLIVLKAQLKSHFDDTLLFLIPTGQCYFLLDHIFILYLPRCFLNNKPREARFRAFFSYILFHSARHIMSTQEMFFGYTIISIQTIIFNMKPPALISLLSDHTVNLEGPKKVMKLWSILLLPSLPLTHDM